MDKAKYYVTKQADRTTPYVVEITADTKEDLDKIEKNTYAPGSTVIVLEDSSVYMLSTEKEWKLL